MRWFVTALLLLACQGHAVELSLHTVVVDGHPLAVWEKSAARPVRSILLVHGRTWSARPDFDLQAPGESLSLMDGLVAQGAAVYAVDLRGYGATPRDASGWLTPSRAAADVAAVLDWLGARQPQLPRPYLFGWSYGSMVAQLVVQMAPERVSGLILFGYPMRPGIDQDLAPMPTVPPRQPNTAEAAASDFITPGSISAPAVEAFVTAALATDPVRMDWRDLTEWQRLDAGKVSVPVLLLQGEHDPIALDDEHAQLFAGLATSDKAWVVLAGGDHAAFMETPRDYFLSAIAAFMQRRPCLCPARHQEPQLQQLHGPHPAH